jgi:hypothetical protein
MREGIPLKLSASDYPDIVVFFGWRSGRSTTNCTIRPSTSSTLICLAVPRIMSTASRVRQLRASLARDAPSTLSLPGPTSKCSEPSKATTASPSPNSPFHPNRLPDYTTTTAILGHSFTPRSSIFLAVLLSRTLEYPTPRSLETCYLSSLLPLFSLFFAAPWFESLHTVIPNVISRHPRRGHASLVLRFCYNFFLITPLGCLRSEPTDLHYC